MTLLHNVLVVVSLLEVSAVCSSTTDSVIRTAPSTGSARRLRDKSQRSTAVSQSYRTRSVTPGPSLISAYCHNKYTHTKNSYY